jgi:quercetin dioxygenase-like cupin family protein
VRQAITSGPPEAERWPGAGERVIVNPVSGEHIVVRTSGAQTGGRLLAFDLFLPPGSQVPARHAHPIQAEQFTVVAGRIRFVLGRRTILARPGETILVPAGTPHWFGNAGSDVAQARVEVRPALRTEELLEASAALARAGRFLGARLPRPTDLALFLLEFQCEIAVPDLPAIVVRTVLVLLACLGRHHHRDARPVIAR